MGTVMMFGGVNITSFARQQKINSKRSTEAELIGVNKDTLKKFN